MIAQKYTYQMPLEKCFIASSQSRHFLLNKNIGGSRGDARDGQNCCAVFGKKMLGKPVSAVQNINKCNR